MLERRSSGSSLGSAFEPSSSLYWSGQSSSTSRAADSALRTRGGEVELVLQPLGGSEGCFGADSLEDHFELLPGRMLGSGGSGSQVLEAVGRQSGKRVAVKSYDKEALEAMGWPSARAEIEIMDELDHPGIVRLEGFYETETQAHVVMERLGGGDLFERVRQLGAMSEALSASIATQVLKAVAHVHAKGIVHRDLKPENIMFLGSEHSDSCPGGGDKAVADAAALTIKIIDFGLAARLRPRGPRWLRQRCGTLEWAAPEVVSGKGYDEKADMWSLGATFWALLTGTPLYRGDRQEIGRKSPEGSVDFGRERFTRLSEGAKDFLRSLLVVDPAARKSAQDALRHPWLHSLTDAFAAEGATITPGGKIQTAGALGSMEGNQCNRSWANFEGSLKGSACDTRSEAVHVQANTVDDDKCSRL